MKVNPNGIRVEDIRRDFPLIQNSGIAYLDNAATTQKPRSVIEALTQVYEQTNANVHRGVYEISERATEAYEGVREKIARFIGISDPASIIFTRNATEAINLVAYAWGNSQVRSGDEILLGEMEHHSNIVPWQLLAGRHGAKIKYVPFDPATGKPRWSELKNLLTPRTRLVALAHVSNALGTINPVPELIQDIRRLSQARILVDAAQGAPHFKISVKEWDCDFLAFSAHKMLGPTGIGVLYAKKEILSGMEPFLGGGDMIREVTLEGSKWNDLPWKFEAGTPNFADAIAFGAALDYLERVGFDYIWTHEQQLAAFAMERLAKIPGSTLYGTRTSAERCGIVSFNLQGIHAHDVGTLLAREKVAVRVGHHCNMPLMKQMGVMGTVRASFYIYNTLEEIETLVEAIPKVQKVFA